jgi:hypothetical protein
MAIATVEDRLERLSTASARRVLEPDEVVTGDFGPGQIVPDELLLTAGLDLDLDAETNVDSQSNKRRRCSKAASGWRRR